MPGIDGFDPLAAEFADRGPSITQVFEDASRRVVHNILKSYTGYYDLFSELLQNSMDAVQSRQRHGPPSYRPTIWITIDVPDSLIRVVDNGVGMSEDEFKFCLRPSVSFKKQADLRGHKGVGPRFLRMVSHSSSSKASRVAKV